MINRNVDTYFTDGCGRCALGGTPDCKVHRWENELQKLRILLLDCGLTEVSKWGVPCYVFQQKNVVLLTAFKEYCALSFFKGALLNDENGLLTQQTEQTQATRQIRFTDVQTINSLETQLKNHVFEAIEIEKAGLIVDFSAKTTLVFPTALLEKFDENPDFRTAFEALTPGRQRAYNLHFTAPKQAVTRVARIEKYIQKILNGKGINEE